MSAEIAAADAAGIEVVNADKLRYKLEHDRRAWLEEYAKLHACEFCRGSRLHTCTSYRCQQPYREATSMRRNFLQVDKVKSPLRYGNTLEG